MRTETRVYRVSWETNMGLFNNDGMYVGVDGEFDTEDDGTGWYVNLGEVGGYTVAHVVTDIAQAALDIDPDDDIGLGRFGIRRVDTSTLEEGDEVVFCKSGHEPMSPEDVETRHVQWDNVHDEHWDTSFVLKEEDND